MSIYLPSPYLKFWWSDIRLNPRDKVDFLIITFVMIGVSFKVIKLFYEYRSFYDKK